MLDKQGRTPEEAAKYWHDAFWDMMWKKYNDLPLYIRPELSKVLCFKDWWMGQIEEIRKEEKRLIVLNYKQASMLMERDFDLRRAKPYRLRYLEVRELRKNMKKAQEEKDVADNIISFDEARLALASKEPPSGGNWLSNLPVETRFLAFKKTEHTPFLEDFMVGTDPKQMPAVLLGYELAHPNGGWKWCDPVKFSRDYGYFMTIQTKVENNDGNSVPEGTVGGDGQCEVVPPLHEKE